MPDDKDKNRESENAKSYLFRFHFIKMLKEKLRSLTEDETETDPEEIRSLVYLLKKYGYTPPPPEEFEKDKFLDRFYLKNSLGPYRYRGKLGRWFALWKKRNDPKIKPFKQLTYVTMAMMVGLTLLVFDYITYAGNFKEVYQVQRYAKDDIHIHEIYKQISQPTKENQILPDKYFNNIYLPTNLVNESLEFEYVELSESELFITTKNKNEWLNIVVKVDGTELRLDYKLGNSDTLQDDICKWNNSQVYYNEITKVTNIIFEINTELYIVFSNIPKKELINIVNNMEVYK